MEEKQKTKKAFYKKWWVWAIAIILIIAIANSGDDTSHQTSPKNSDSVVTEKQEISAEQSKPESKKSEEESIPKEYRSALKKAETYSEMMNMSKQGIYDQLTSEYGEKFSPEAAQYAIDNIQADWNKNALEKAKVYQDEMSMSPSAIHDQLTSEYGEKFTKEEADYAIANLE